MTKQPPLANTFHTSVEGLKSEPLQTQPFDDTFVQDYSSHQPLPNPPVDMAEPSAQQTDVLSASGLWGDTQFSDASISIGDHNWKVHRWVICRQSDYFMRALEGAFTEAHNKTIVLVNQDFTAVDIEAMLKFLYTGQFQEHHARDAVKAFVIGGYFKIQTLRDAAIHRIKLGLDSYIRSGYWRNWRKLAVQFLSEYEGTEIEQTLVQVTAYHARILIHQPLAMWDELVESYPSFANKVLKLLFHKPPEPQPQTALVKRLAFDDGRSAN